MLCDQEDKISETIPIANDYKIMYRGSEDNEDMDGLFSDSLSIPNYDSSEITISEYERWLQLMIGREVSEEQQNLRQTSPQGGNRKVD